MYQQSELERLKKICNGEKKPKKLELNFGDHLRLKLNGLSIPYLRKIFELNLCPEGTRLSFNCCHSINDGLRTLFRVIAEVGSPLNLKIILQNNHKNLESNILRELAHALNSGKCGNGLTISFNDNAFEIRDIAFLAATLASGNMPENLSLEFTQCNLDADSACYFSEALKSGLVKKGLHLGFQVNKIRNFGFKDFSDAFASGKCPENLSINLWNNKIGRAGFTYLSKALESGLCPSGLSLNLRCNDLDRESIHLLSNALASGKAPSHLTLIFDQAINEHCQSLGSMFASGRSPEYLHLQFHGELPDSAITLLAKGIGSGQCSRGLQMDFTLCSLSAKSIALLLDTARKGKCPENFTLRFEEHVFRTAQSPVTDVVQSIQSPSLSKGFALSLKHCSITHDEVDTLIEAMKRQKASSQFRLFIGNRGTDRQKASIYSLEKRYLIQKTALIILGLMDPHSTLYQFDLNILEYICQLIESSKWPVFKAVHANMSVDEKCLIEPGDNRSKSNEPYVIPCNLF